MKPISQQVTIKDADRGVDFVIDVTFDQLPDDAPTGFLGGREISCVQCVEIVTWVGKRAASAFPGQDADASLEDCMGEDLLEKYPDEIDAELDKLNAAIAG